jgi:hypothetical protein
MRMRRYAKGHEFLLHPPALCDRVKVYQDFTCGEAPRSKEGQK